MDLVAQIISNPSVEARAYPVFRRHGFHLLRDSYLLPIPDDQDMAYLRPSEMVGVDIDAARIFDFLETAIQPYKAEFNAFPVHEAPPGSYYLVNGSYMAIDGNVYYGLIRHFKPRRIVEIGAGNSTLLAAAAIRKNGTPTELIAIEPYPSPILKAQIPELTELIVKRVQDVELPFFEALGENDILFIDSSHVLRPGGDVWWEFCEILPRLQSGVLVHVHDISLPKPYPHVYYENRWYWNEQYLLQVFLSFNSRFEVIWPGNYMMEHHTARMTQAFSPEYGHMRAKYPQSEPSSFWLRVQ
ncbi:MAG: class I SAM-dependent methyltransferase [Anaerolineae bacterium]